MMAPVEAYAAEETDRARVVRFLRDFAVRTAGRTEELPWGVAVFNDELPLVWDVNLVWVDAVPRAMTAERLAGDLDRIQGGAGLAHRHAIVADEAGGARLAPGLAALGWSVKRHLLMCQRHAPDRAPDPSLAREVDASVIRAFTEASLRRDAAGFSEEAVRQISALKDVVAEAGARFFAVDVDGEIACGCDLYADGRIAQIEAVMTLEEHRNRGLARAVVASACAEARSEGNELVFLEAEENDWPKELYRKLGFETVGETHVFMRAPGDPAGAPQS